MASLKKEEFVRQHQEIELAQAPLTLSAVDFFSDLTKTAAEGNVCVNCVSSSFEESGLYELRNLVSSTGGFIISVESWSNPCVQDSLEKYFSEDIFGASGGECTLAINSSKEFRISGCVGPCVSANRFDEDLVSQKTIGAGSTVEWRSSCLLPTTSLAFFFDVSASKISPIPSGTTSFLQFVTKYRHLGSGLMRLRVTTVYVSFADLSLGKREIGQGFDQEAAAILIARRAMWEVQCGETAEAVHEVDRTLIHFCRTFGSYRRNDPGTFTLSENFTFLPHFLYHFRRSPFLSTFNSSPDETTSLRHSLLCEDVTNSLFMIQPTLVRYALNRKPEPVLLDTASIVPDAVLLLDTFFRVCVWHGAKIAAWRNEGYHEKEEYANLKQVLEGPREEAMILIGERFPTPALVFCDQGSSEERFLLTRCNTSVAPFDAIYGTKTDSLETDEPSLKKFSDKLKEIAVLPG
jgi:protein transport protein SEC23